MTISDQCVVSMHYTLTNKAGEELDSSKGGEPLDYLHGAANLIPGLEKELTGKSVGDEVSVTVSPEDGYGIRDEDLVMEIPRSDFEGVDELEPGMQFQFESQDGSMRIITVTEVAGDTVTVDGNHALAGDTLHFEVRIEGIRKATEEEVAHGHVHGPGHCH